MLGKLEIIGIRGREILDFKGDPAVEVEVQLGGGVVGRAVAPSGASTGKFEAMELWDGGRRYRRLGVKKVMEHVSTILAEAITFRSALDQRHVDRLLRKADGTENKEDMGANAILGVSIAVTRATANGLEMPLYRYLGEIGAHELPVPMTNILNGGVHANNTMDLQEFMIMPTEAESLSEGLQMCTKIYHILKKVLKAGGYAATVDDGGGFTPNLRSTEKVLSYIMDAIKSSGYEADTQVKIAIDTASSELYNEKSGMYVFPGESQTSGIRVERTAEEMMDYYLRLVDGFPIISIEDELQGEDWEGWQLMTRKLGHRVQLVGDDLFVTNTKRLKERIGLGATNSILVRMNQIGTLPESFDAVEMVKQAEYATVISHHPGEMEDSIVTDTVVAVSSGQIKTRTPCRSDRVAKYNQLLRIEEDLYAK